MDKITAQSMLKFRRIKIINIMWKINRYHSVILFYNHKHRQSLFSMRYVIELKCATDIVQK